MPNFNLVNQACLDKILKAKVIVHSNGQLRATHLILDYTPISKSFLAPKYVIKAKDPRLQRFSVAAPRFLICGPIPEGTLTTDPIPEGIPKVALPSQQTTGVVTSSRLAHTEEEEEEEVVEVSDSKDKFEVFNQALSPKTSTFDLDHPSLDLGHLFVLILDEMEVQCKTRSNLLDLVESQPKRDAPGKATQTKPPTPPPALPLQLGPANLKRKRELKGKKVAEVGKTHPT